MIKKIGYFLMLFPILLQAQFTIKGSIKSTNKYTWILLYKLEKGQQTFVDNAAITDGAFQFEIAQKERSGVYRAYYQMENNLYVEFIYNQEDIDFTFDANYPMASIDFASSDENKIYQEYYLNISSKQDQIDSLQVAYFKSGAAKTDKEIRSEYQNRLKELQAIQSDFETRSEGKLAQHFIKASKQFNAEVPFKMPKDYLDSVKLHFFDAIDFQDTVLSNATFINDRLVDYVLYLNQADNMDSRNILQKQAIADTTQKLGENFELLKNFEESLLQNYMLDENKEMLEFVMYQYYHYLPDTYQDAALQYKIKASLKTALGSEAADFSWVENGRDNNLHSLIGSDYYIVVFFSATCPHCQVEMPKFHNFIKDIENIKVIAVGLEDAKENWTKMTAGFTDFINIIDLDKWQSQKVKDYGITAIPSYFVLDANKKILAKPNDVEALKNMFQTQ